MKTTIFINDIKQDYRHHAFFSPSSAGLGYSTLPREAFGPMGGAEYDAKPADMTTREWNKAIDTFERRIEAQKRRGEWYED